MAEDQRNARIFGVLFIITFVTSIGALALFQSVLDDPAGTSPVAGRTARSTWAPSWSSSSSSRTSARPLCSTRSSRRQNEILAIGYVAARIIECVFIAAGIIFVLGVVSLRHDSPDAADLAVSLAALKDWTFLFGPGLVVPFGNGLILGYLMYKSGLVPRRMAWLGLIGGPLLLIGNIGVLFDWWEQTGPVSRPGGPRVHLGAVPRDLLRHLGLQAGLPDPRGARHDDLADRRGDARPRRRPRLSALPRPGSGCWPCLASRSRCSSFSAGSSAVATRPTTRQRIRPGRTGRTTTSGRAASAHS